MMKLTSVFKTFEGLMNTVDALASFITLGKVNVLSNIFGRKPAEKSGERSDDKEKEKTAPFEWDRTDEIITGDIKFEFQGEHREALSKFMRELREREILNYHMFRTHFRTEYLRDKNQTLIKLSDLIDFIIGQEGATDWYENTKAYCLDNEWLFDSRLAALKTAPKQLVAVTADLSERTDKWLGDNGAIELEKAKLTRALARQLRNY